MNHNKSVIYQDMRFRDIVRNEKGITLTEIIAGMVVSTILIGLAAIAIITFYTKFKELSYYADLQQHAMDTIETLKYGYGFPDADVGGDHIFLGISNSKSVNLEALSGGWGQYTGIMCYPDRSQPGHENDYVRYYWDANSQSIRMQALYGIRFFQEQIFPRRGDDKIRVTHFNLISATGALNPRVVKLEMKAEVIVSEDKQKEVSYTTTIALAR